MKIAFIVNEFPSLSQTFVLNQITGLIDRGHDIDIFSEEARNNLKFHEDVKTYNLIERTIYLSVPINKFHRIFKGLYYAVKIIQKNPVAVLRSLNIFKYGRKAASLYLLYQIIPFLEKGPYDIIHCQFGMLAPKSLLLKHTGVLTSKFITSFRGYDASRYVHNRPCVYDELFREGDLFLTVCQYLKQRLIEEGCDAEKIIVLHSGIDCERFEYSNRTRSEDGPTKLLTIARLVEKKGVAYAIKAVSILVSSGKHITYDVIGGDGGLRDDLEQMIEDLGMEKYIRLLGWRNQDEVIRALKNSDILVAPSITATNGDQEGIPNTIKEAMAMGLPVISTLHSGISELVEDGVSGFLVPECDLDSLTDRLAYLIDHPEIWHEMGQHGRKKVENDFDVNKLNDRLVEIYQRLLSDS